MRRYPNILHAFLLVFLVLVIQILFIIISGIFNVSTNSLEAPLAAGIINLVSLGIVISVGLKKNNVSFKQQYSFKPVNPSLVLPMVVTIAGLSILLSDVDNLVNSILPMPAPYRTLFNNLLTDSWGFLVLILIAPVTEELLFRGLILDSFLSNYSVKTSIIVSSILFGLVHFNPWQFIAPIVIGIVLAWWYVETKSVLACMLGHAVFNGIPKLLYSMNFNIPGYTSYSEKVVFQPWWFDIIGLILFGAGIFILYKRFRKYEHQRGIT